MEENFDEDNFYYASVDKAFLSLRDNELKEIEQRISDIFDENRNVLDIFQNSSVIPNEDIFNEKVEAFINLMGQNSNVTRPNYNLLDLTKNKNI